MLKFYVPSTRTRLLFLKKEIFFSVLTFLQHNDVFGNQKRRCSKTVPKVTISENVGFSFFYAWTDKSLTLYPNIKIQIIPGALFQDRHQKSGYLYLESSLRERFVTEYFY